MPKLPDVDSLGPSPTPENLYRAQGYDGTSVGKALAGAGQDLMQASRILNQEAKRDELASAQRGASELGNFTVDYMTNPETGALNRRGMDAFNLPDKFSQDYDAKVSEIRKTLSKRAQKAFDLDAATRKNESIQALNRHVSQEKNVYLKGQTDAFIATSAQTAALNYNTPEYVEINRQKARDSARAYMTSQGLSPEEINIKLKEVDGQVYGTVIDRMATNGDVMKANAEYRKGLEQGIFSAQQIESFDKYFQTALPQAKAKAIVTGLAGVGNNTGKSDFDAAVNHVLKIEGGYVENDGGAGPTLMGINSRANPEEYAKIKALHDAGDTDGATSEASSVYKAKYWDAINGDSLPPATALVAFDAAVNQGPGVAKELLRKSGGDPAKMIAMRRLQYEDLAETNPEKAKYLEGWMNRLDNLQGVINRPSGQVDLETVRKATASESVDVQQQALDQAQKFNTDIAAVERQKNDAAVEETWGILNNNGGDFTKVPPNVMENLTQQQIASFRKTGGENKTDPGTYLEIRNRITQGQNVNVLDPNFQLSREDRMELGKLQQDPASRANARTLDEKLKAVESTLIKGIDGKDIQDTRIEQFQRRVRAELNKIQQETKKIPDDNQQNAVIDRLMMDGILSRRREGFFEGVLDQPFLGVHLERTGREGFAFEKLPNERFEVPGIPYFEGQFPLAGKIGGRDYSVPVTYNELIQQISEALTTEGIPVTSENVAERYKLFVEKTAK